MQNALNALRKSGGSGSQNSKFAKILKYGVVSISILENIF